MVQDLGFSSSRQFQQWGVVLVPSVNLTPLCVCVYTRAIRKRSWGILAAQRHTTEWHFYGPDWLKTLDLNPPSLGFRVWGSLVEDGLKNEELICHT